MTNLPTYEECEAKLDSDEALDLVEIFILENEPAGNENSEQWRNQLESAMGYYAQNYV